MRFPCLKSQVNEPGAQPAEGAAAAGAQRAAEPAKSTEASAPEAKGAVRICFSAEEPVSEALSEMFAEAAHRVKAVRLAARFPAGSAFGALFAEEAELARENESAEVRPPQSPRAEHTAKTAQTAHSVHSEHTEESRSLMSPLRLEELAQIDKEIDRMQPGSLLDIKDSSAILPRGLHA